MERLITLYNTNIRPELAKELSIDNPMAVPKVVKVTVNIGLNQLRSDEKKVASLSKALASITGQVPARRRARKAIASFKLRQGDLVGLSLTLRGPRMYDFLERLIRIALPRVRDFRGIARTNFDGHGNLTIGLRELSIFPEIRFEDVDVPHGLEVTIVTTAKTNEQGEKLLARLGVPFRVQDKG